MRKKNVAVNLVRIPIQYAAEKHHVYMKTYVWRSAKVDNTEGEVYATGTFLI